MLRKVSHVCLYEDGIRGICSELIHVSKKQSFFSKARKEREDGRWGYRTLLCRWCKIIESYSWQLRVLADVSRRLLKVCLPAWRPRGDEDGERLNAVTVR
jgi:hypothetical protein